MKFLANIALLLGLILICSSCKVGRLISLGGAPDCTCGNPDTALLGCYSASCVSGMGNPACFCGGFDSLAGTGSEGAGGTASSRLIGQQQILFLASGKTVRGKLVMDDGAKITLQTNSGERELNYAELAPRSVYRLEKGRTPASDGPGLIRLGDLARKSGFWAHANRHYQAALEADPTLKPRVETAVAELRKEASEAVLAKAREDMQKKHVKDAEKRLATILNEFPGEKAAVEAAAMLDRIRSEERTRSAPARDKQLDELFGSAVADIEAATDNNHKGLVNKNQSRSLNSYRNALSRLERARRKLESIASKNKDDRVIVERASDLDQQAVELYVSTTLNLVSTRMVQTSYDKALDAVNRAIAIAPKDQRLLSARARIEDASGDSDWGFGWIRQR